MNILDLEQEEFKEKPKKELKKCYTLNNTEGMEKRMIWDPSKAFMIGYTIQDKQSKGEKK